MKERYKQGFPIIKEIIQNANDGGATTLDFGIVQGLDQSDNHPLPLLKHLKTIRFFISENSGHLKQQFSVSLDNSLLSRCIYPNNKIENIESKENKLQGKVSLSSENIKISFAGIERVLPAQDFTLLLGQNPNNISQYFWTDLQQSQFWSKRSSINEDGDNESVPDKSIPHCAVVFTQQPLGNKPKARLTLQWSVFLPLASEDNHLQQEEAEQEAHEEIDCNGDKNYTLFLHGYFFSIFKWQKLFC
ncbi:hypothetical protein [Planktothrix mougeotii]|uniref:Uncharacterized protein n=1 Tax=Planktothrix mougeotii LEGE 06226 TaxID=1828728 RepID=A0ABR9UCT4_9CYAN|nr:hypothetical protein [Planktothrix mougeotii]MBE9144280.1 hypothetical protein [Planktothrix mougeotii LEGE 06226]